MEQDFSGSGFINFLGVAVRTGVADVESASKYQTEMHGFVYFEGRIIKREGQICPSRCYEIFKTFLG